MSSTTSTSIFSSQKLEDLLLLSTPFVIALANSSVFKLVPGNLGFVFGVAIAAIAKALSGLTKSGSSYEDILSFTIVAVAVAGGLLTANANFLIVGTILGLIAKALPSLQAGLNPEDLILTIGAILAGVGASFNVPAATDFGLLLAAWGKAIPSLVSSSTSAPVAKPASS